MKKFCRFILKLIGWRIAGNTDYPRKCVICVAPHTSNWDLILGQIIYRSMGRKANFLMKKSWFFFPLNIVFNAMGGIAVDRTKNNSLTDSLAEEFEKRDKFQLAVTPEGTRKKTESWKMGFYYIALAAHVPIVVVALDYENKIADFKMVLTPSGDAEKDVALIKSCYAGVKGRNPEQFSL